MQTTLERRAYAHGTWVETQGPWATFVKARAICPDGALRVVKLAITADTLFTVPAKVSYKVRGRSMSVCGFITFASTDGLSTNPDQWVRFVPTGKHKNVFGRTGVCPKCGKTPLIYEVPHTIPEERLTHHDNWEGVHCEGSGTTIRKKV